MLGLVSRREKGGGFEKERKVSSTSSFSLDPSGEIHLDSQEGSDQGGGQQARLGQYNTVRRGRRKKWKRGHFEILHTASGVGPTLFHPPSVPMLHARTDGLAPTPAPLESVPRSGISKRWDLPSPGARMFPPICVSGARAKKRGERAGSSLIAFWGLSILRPVAKVRGESGGGHSHRIQPLFVTLLGKAR